MPSKKETAVTPQQLESCEAFMSLTPKQRKFILEYLKDYNGTQAAIRAGYSAKTARSTAADYLAKPNISTALKEISEIIVTRDIADVQEVREFLTTVMRGNITDVCKFTESGLMFNKSSDEMSPNISRLIKKIKVTEKTTATDNILETKTDIEIHDPIRAAELLGKSHGMFTEKVEHSGNVTIEVVDYAKS